ncbi:MAG TPA: Holliday junction branch migration protein RuvA [Candidatus Avilachnospira avistercoris]|nr:Holliday junction branch migration protein RuvA [Candidatus Avilachnospira avistercoris]
MISFIHGTLVEKDEGYIVVEAGGVGYGINVPLSVLSQLPPEGEELRIYTHYSVREDGQSLYGFLFREDREMFRRLISVNGVGPKGALSILSVLGPDDLRLAIVTGDAKSISRAPGIGQKTAQRVILDLKDKIGNDILLRRSDDMGSEAGLSVSGAAAGSAMSEAIDALTVLGYTRIEAARAVRRADVSEDAGTEEILKQALRVINR